MLDALRDGLADLRKGLKMWRVWMALAHEDIGDQHRRTTLGPFWLLLNYLAFVGTFVVVFDRSVEGINYPAYVASGLLVWFFIMETINQSVTLFAREEAFIKGSTLPLSVYVLRLTMQSLIRAGYALIGCVVILMISGVAATAGWLWAAVGIAVILVATPAVIIVFAFLGAFFPDSQFVVSNLMRIGMFLTPVFWVHGGEGGIRGAFYVWNPFTYFLEIVRAPILTGDMPAFAFALCLALTAAVWLTAIALFSAFRRDVVFVL